ncbi:MAG: putative bifunctional diguanylate cyclase/phosphodiesterase, partial [Alphaproteobacteria bacterium]
AIAGIAHEVLEQVSRPYDVDGREVFISACIGVAIYPDNADNASTLLKRVDTALNEAKRMGSGHFKFYSSELSAHVERYHQLESGLRRALDRGEMALHYQPKVDLANRQVVGAEALLRWTSTELGPIPPGEFIPVAEETGLIIPIGEWVLREACTQVERWLKQGLPAVKVAVNLSPRQFQDTALLSRIVKTMSDTSMNAELLELELTESMLVANADEAVQALRALRGLGISLSIDDFGTGYSSLSYLKRFPIDALKIDQSFVRDIPNNRDDAAITRAIVSMAKSLDLMIVAEGLEQIAQIQFLEALGCDQGQGYYFSRPVPADEFMRTFLAMNVAASSPSVPPGPRDP